MEVGLFQEKRMLVKFIEISLGWMDKRTSPWTSSRASPPEDIVSAGARGRRGIIRTREKYMVRWGVLRTRMD